MSRQADGRARRRAGIDPAPSPGYGGAATAPARPRPTSGEHMSITGRLDGGDLVRAPHRPRLTDADLAKISPTRTTSPPGTGPTPAIPRAASSR
ncbi:hypothetical protein [Brachybacterium sp. GPGPB12]|uniref:hypothetical protein n=1 Tax=Brachybacterium sp. GPGPB12 TaxID=3023517 RepID=UPI0031344492